MLVIILAPIITQTGPRAVKTPHSVARVRLRVREVAQPDKVANLTISLRVHDLRAPKGAEKAQTKEKHVLQ